MPNRTPPRAVAVLGRAEEREVVDGEQPFGLAQRVLGRLHRERIGAAPAVAVELDLPGGVRGEQTAGVGSSDAPVVEAVREHDDVAGEAVAADVRRLPHAFGVGLVPEGVVQRTPVQGAAPVPLAVRADDVERPLDRLRAGDRRRVAQGQNGREVEAEQLVLVLDLELEEPLLPGPRRAEEHATARVGPALRLLDEQEPRVRERRDLGAQVLLQLRREQAPTERVPRPGSPVLDQDPVVDAAGGRRERLPARARDGRAERALRRRGLEWCAHGRNASCACLDGRQVSRPSAGNQGVGLPPLRDPDGDVRAGVRPELAHDVLQVGLDRVAGDQERGGDVRVRALRGRRAPQPAARAG